MGKKDIFETDEQIAKRLERYYLEPYSDKIKKLELTYAEEQKRLKTQNKELLSTMTNKDVYVYVANLTEEQKKEIKDKVSSYDARNLIQAIHKAEQAEKERIAQLEREKQERLVKGQKRSFGGMKI